MKMHVLVGIDMVEPQTGRAKRLELRADLRRQAGVEFAAERKTEPLRAPYSDRIRRPPRTRPRTSAPGRTGRPSTSTRCRPTRRLRQPARPRHRVGRRRAADHQARGRQNAVPMRLFDGLVDGRVEPEIVGADDQASQLAISRLRRN